MSPSPPSPPPLPTSPPVSEVAASQVRVAGASGTAATCFSSDEGGCSFGYALALTPVLLTTSPANGNEGDTLTVTGHSLSLTASENIIEVGGESCDVLSASEDTSFTPPDCPVTSCTQQMRTVTTLTCKLPHLDSRGPHSVTLGTRTGGISPRLDGATVVTSPELRNLSPASGSMAGGTQLTLYGDGLSSRKADLEVTVGGVRCPVTSTNASHVTCTTPSAADLSATSTAAIELKVRGVSAACVCSSESCPCNFEYSSALTPILTATTVQQVNATHWTLVLSGTFGSGDDFPLEGTVVTVGEGPSATACTITEAGASSITCVSAPPRGGSQTISMQTPWGAALGQAEEEEDSSRRRRLQSYGATAAKLPSITGASFDVSGFSPAQTTLAGGSTLTITGSDFAPFDTSVRVCGRECGITSVTPTSITCEAPSLLNLETGVRSLTLADVFDATSGLPPSLPPAPPGVPHAPPVPQSPVPEPLARTAVAASMSSWGGAHYAASKCIDGDASCSGATMCHGASETDPWFSMQLNSVSWISQVVVTGRCGINGRRLGHFQVWVGSAAGQYAHPARMCGEYDIGDNWGGTYTIECNGGLNGDFVTVVQPGSSRLLNLQEVQAFGTDMLPPAPPVAPPSPPDLSSMFEFVPGVSVALAFRGINSTSLPRGATLRSAVLRVTPRQGRHGSLVVGVSAMLACNGQITPGGGATIEWDVQSYDMGFDSDTSPDLTSLLVDSLAGRSFDSGQQQSCDVLLSLTPAGEDGARYIDGPRASEEARRPRLELVYDSPTTAEQLAWTSDQSCDVAVSVPMPLPANGTCQPVDAASRRAIADTSVCPHLHLSATAATTLSSCSMSVNGLDLFSDAGFGLNRLVVGRDGVCVAMLDSGTSGTMLPRAACFDTQTEGEGAEQLAAWIDTLPHGAMAMIVSCSRFAFTFNLQQLAESFALLGALGTPRYSDDTYALIGMKGAATPLAEDRTQCCDNPSGDASEQLGLALGRICLTCDQTPAVAASDVSCGARIGTAPSVLPMQPFGEIDSESSVAAVSEAVMVATSSSAVLSASAASDGFGAIGALQEADVDVFDAAYSSSLSEAAGDRYGAQLATDGDTSTYWMSVGAPDAVLTLDLGLERTVTAVTFDWLPIDENGALAAANSILVLYTTSATGDADWSPGASVLNAWEPTISLSLSDGGANAALGVMARRLRLYLRDAAFGSAINASLPMFALRELTATSCVLPERVVTASTALVYSKDLSPLVSSVYPTRGSTAGGTVITLQVEGLPSGASVGDVSVSVVGLPCVVTSVSSSEVVCLTSSYGVTFAGNPGVGPVELTIEPTGRAAATSNATYQYIDLWSRYTTWGSSVGGADGITRPGIDTDGDSVWIQIGQHILLDADVSVYMLVVQGTLEFDRKDLRLDASYIFVMNGAFIVGTEAEPFVHQALITLHGTPVSREIPVYGAKSISCRECTLDLHGRPLLGGRTHTKLARTALAGATELWLMEAVDWDVGAQIVVTSSAANGTMEEYDLLRIADVANGGQRLVLDAPLAYHHLGETRHFAQGYTVDFRCNVALLSRNVVVQGGGLAQLDRHGVHIMLHSRGKASIVDRSQGESLTARIENIEVRYAGQMGRIGRYPIHFHMIGAVRNSYVRSNSIHHTYNRAIAIHGVHYLRVQDNVAFETRGHTFFVEDGLESKNRITGNLAALTRELFVGLSTDATPSSYWLVNGDNYVDGNIAAGSSHYGFWFFPESKVRGASELEKGAQQVCPQGTPITHLSNNEAHNNGKYGLRIFTGLNHNGEGLPGFYPRKTDPCAPVSASNPFEPSEFRGQFSWRNGMNGITFGSVAALRLVDAVVADNVMRGIEGTAADGVASGTNSMTQLRGPWGANMLIRPTFIGHAQDNCPACDHTWMPSTSSGFQAGRFLRVGLMTPASWGLTVENATFINYDRQGIVAIGGFAKAAPPGAGYTFITNGGQETRFAGTTWVQSTYRVQFRWQSDILLTDLDGTFADQPFCAGCHVLHSPLLVSADSFPDCYYDARYTGAVCKPNYNVVLVGFTADKPCGPCFHPSVRLSYRNAEGFFVRPEDSAYLRGKWRPAGSFNLVELDVATDQMQLRVIGEHDAAWQPGWTHATATWLSQRRLSASFSYYDQMVSEDGTLVRQKASGYEGIISSDGTTLTWDHSRAFFTVDPAQLAEMVASADGNLASGRWTEGTHANRMVRIRDLNRTHLELNETRQLYTDVAWYNCELLPHRCASDMISYPSLPDHRITHAVTSEATIKGNLQ